MHWYEQVLRCIVGILVLAKLLGLPGGVIYAAYRLREERELTGWRVWVGRIGVFYSTLLLASAIGWLFWRDTGEWGPRMVTILSGPIGLGIGAFGMLFAIFGKARVRLGIAMASIGACVFWLIVGIVW